MENDAATTLYCSNELCLAANPLSNNFCQKCRTPLPKRYLWAVASGKSVGNPGEIFADRYLAISNSIFLDTKPGLVPQAPDVESLQTIRAYLRLIPYRLHVPQVYGVLSLNNGKTKQEILLLEKSPLRQDSEKEVQPCRSLFTAWSDATSMRQLNWLWQMAELWQPLKSENVASSLLDSQLLRAEGSLLRLLELRADEPSSPELHQLGEFWQQLVPKTKPAISEFVREICRHLVEGEISSSDELLAILDKGLVEIGRSQTPTIKIATKSDTGPSRQRNEDACYPSSGSIIDKPPNLEALVIVCDGIGGHEGGNIASNLAIETIQQQTQHLTKLSSERCVNPSIVLTDLEQAAADANDKISQRNDSEHRHGRQRMGTTLVMALPVAHEMYTAHVGDSRAYWMTRHGCYQVTLDDDVASREVRLGYATYRDAVRQGASGSLVQALGMSPSTSLHPTIQRFILDEDCVFLLCSDGLSDFDRVEQHWETEILPILTEKKNVTDVVDTLVEIANHQNGHDNVTIALLHYQVKYSEPKSNLKADLAHPSSTPANNSSYRTSAATQNRSQNQKTQVLSDTAPPKGHKIPLQLVIPLVLALGAGLLTLLIQQRWQTISKLIQPNPFQGSRSPGVTASSSESFDKLNKGSFIKTNNPISLSTTTDSTGEAIAPQYSLLQVISIDTVDDSHSDPHLQLRVCQVPATPTSIPKNTETPHIAASTPAKPSLKPGDTGSTYLSKIKYSISLLPPKDSNKCLYNRESSVPSTLQPGAKRDSP
ncbi:MAG: protein phosphatase 2C domain-containing protein [Rhizonema sp. NSF051]|nr:protein phosphatase 2C domain-containing protein [Rhizonema sp. NSF051]